jgi:cell division protein FtsW
MIGQWWWTVDRWTLLVVVTLALGGVVFSLAASPPVANRLGLDSYHFVYRQLTFLAPTAVLLVGASLLSPRGVRRLAALVLLGGISLMVLTLFVGPEVKGAHRWLFLGPFSVQPSEFVKPAFVVLAAWLFAEGANNKNVPGNAISACLFGIFLVLLVLQPDFGQAVLVSTVWGAMFFLSGVSWPWIGGMTSFGFAGLFAAYSFVPHVASRIDRFLDPENGDTFQIDKATDAFANGGMFGMGPGEGRIKQIIPDAHTDFVFAVLAEEFGLVLCLIVIGLFCVIVMRGLLMTINESDAFVQLAAAGLTILFGLQAVINMAVNLSLLPAKGMTLPFLSYGGSSLLSLALTIGMLLALTRRRASYGFGMDAPT